MGVNREKLYKKIQTTVVILIWLILFLLPVFNIKNDEGNSWEVIFTVWKLLTPFLFLYLVNRTYLTPYFFFKNKRVLFLASNFILILGVSAFLTIYQSNGMGGTMPPNAKSGLHHDRPVLPPRSAIEGSGVKHQGPPGRGVPGGIPPQGTNGPMAPPKQMPPFLSFAIISLLIVAADTGVLIVARWEKAERKRIALEKESTEHKMAFLRNQLSPHFFMNTLNNIHSLIDISGAEAQDAIIKLSRMMSYMLYESQTETVPLRKELDFVHSYVELMRLRVSDKVPITVEMPEHVPDINVPPLLTISYIENAFKYGVSYQEESYINIKFAVQDDTVFFETENKTFANKKKTSSTGSGLGMVNAKNRLDLIYGRDYVLLVEDSEQTFKVNLKIPSC